MTIRAAHLALGNLCLDGRPARSLSEEVADVGDFSASNVVEIQHDDVCLVAVHAWMRFEEGAHAASNFELTFCVLRVDHAAHSRLVRLVVPFSVSAGTIAAPRLEAVRFFGVLVELVQRFFGAAQAADLHFGGGLQ